MEARTLTVARDPEVRSWMGGLGDATRLEHLTIPGTRHSAACFGPPWAVCQDATVEQQLNDGIRFLDLRCRATNGAFTLHHGEVFQNVVLGEILGDCWDFLRAHPSETVLIRIRQEYSDESDHVFRSLFDRYHRDWRSLLRVGDSIPVLGEARGRVVVLGGRDALPGVRYGDLGTGLDRLRRVRADSARLAVTFTGGAADGTVPRENAAVVNRALLGRLSGAARGRPGFGIVAMDFPESEPGLVRALVDLNGTE
ncbi:phosphatidylinositol-specific phospholipase C domain-containing protein [Streptomyces tsukubensis]|uniref:phosphatidylinositol-specific phospholipase C domain-containing protein n=1 Tax=Streptomyces tsukubensis TaxID=83656 RepID=UPI00344FBE0D